MVTTPVLWPVGEKLALRVMPVAAAWTSKKTVPPCTVTMTFWVGGVPLRLVDRLTFWVDRE